jgi:hypothetical protein
MSNDVSECPTSHICRPTPQGPQLVTWAPSKARLAKDVAQRDHPWHAPTHKEGELASYELVQQYGPKELA